MRFFVCFFLCFFLSFPAAGAYTLKGGVTYTVESARKEAFANVEYTLPKHIIDANRVDPNHKENMKLIKRGVKETDDRFISFFSDDSYQIVYKNNLYYEFYYNKVGKIEYVGKRTSLTYPVKTYKYNVDGSLLLIILYKNQKNSYTFKKNGELSSHWIDGKGYDSNGKFIGASY